MLSSRLYAYAFFIYSFRSTNAVRCVLENNIIKSSMVENCSASVSECFRFQCESDGILTTAKGCEDVNSPSWNCRALEFACSQNSKQWWSKCDTCNQDECNRASTIPTTVIITVISFILKYLYSV